MRQGFQRTLCASSPYSGKHAAHGHDNEMVLHKPFEEWQALDDRVWSTINNNCKGRVMYRTTKKYMGLAPRAAQRRDVIAVLLGCSSPMILRLINQDHFKLVVEANCDGFIDGEALLGPLPSRVKTKSSGFSVLRCLFKLRN